MLNFKWLVEDKNFKDKNCLENTITLHHQTELYETFYNYSLQFKKSARIIAEQTLTEKITTSELDTYFFSIAYLYRQSLELLLKAIGFKFMKTVEEREEYIRKDPHNLLELYIKLSRFISDTDLRGVYWLRNFFSSINTIDKESDAFRYPFHIRREKGIFTIKTVFSEQTDIDLHKFVNKMELAFDLLNKFFNNEKIYNDACERYSCNFIETGKSFYQKSVVGYSYQKDKFYPLVRSYTECAEILYLKYLNDNKLKETIFFPMCYLFRNGLELSMKEILFEECNFEFQEAAKHLNSSKHNLNKLWKKIKPSLIEHSSEDSTIDLVNNYIKQLHDFDSASDKFRYPTDKNLEFHFKNKISLDLKNIYEFFLEIINFFSGANIMLSERNDILREFEAEMEAEMRSEMEDEMRSEMEDEMRSEMEYY